MKVTSEHPIENPSTGIQIACSLCRKEISEKDYESAARRLRSEFAGRLDSFVSRLFYPRDAVVTFLKSRSQILKVKECPPEDIKKIEGYVVFAEDQSGR